MRVKIKKKERGMTRRELLALLASAGIVMPEMSSLGIALPMPNPKPMLQGGTVTALYRISTGEVLKISFNGQTFSDRDQTYYGVLTDPSRPDGNDATDASGNFRVLNFAKFAVVATNTVRNATQGEIDAFSTGETTDQNAQDATQASSLLQTHPQLRKAFKAICQLVVDELNILRGQIIGVVTSSWDAPNMTNGTGATSPNITVTGAALGDFVEVAADASFAGLVAFGYVSAANTVVIRLHNGTGGAVNPGSITYKVCVRRDTALANRTKAQAITALLAAVSAND